MIPLFLIDGFFLILPHTLACIPHHLYFMHALQLQLLVLTWPLLQFSSLYFSSLHNPISSNSRFHPIAESITDHFRFHCRPIPVCLPTDSGSILLAGQFWFCLPANSSFAYHPISNLLASSDSGLVPITNRLHFIANQFWELSQHSSFQTKWPKCSQHK